MIKWISSAVNPLDRPVAQLFFATGALQPILRLFSAV
jgi:hypothetical protein